MKKELSEQVPEILSSLSMTGENQSTLQALEASLMEFETLVDKGLIKKRGNNSFSPIDSTPEVIAFNREGIEGPSQKM